MNYDTATLPTIDNQLVNGWITTSDLQLIAKRVGTPVFIYSEEQLLRNVQRIKDAVIDAGIDNRVEFYVPFFPNSNPHVLKPFQQLDIGLLLQLPSEYELLRRFGFNKFIISTGHVSDKDIDFWAETGHPIFLSSLDEINYLLRTHDQASVNVRFDSLNSGKPGIKYSELQKLSELLKNHGRGLDCFELYCGSGNTVDNMIGIVEQVFMIFRTYFPNAKAINFAGGFGFDYQEKSELKKHFEWGKYLKKLRENADRYGVPQHVKFLFEPARDILGDVGALLLSIERSIIKHPGANRLLTNGSRVLIPSAQYKERRHNVIFLDSTMTEIKSKGIPAALRGRGILRHDYVLPGEYLVPDCIGAQDYLLILDVGAYCATQHMEFLNIPPAAEAVIDKAGSVYLITSHGDKFDKWRYVLPDRKELGSLVAERAAHQP
ncbi:MAG TPA: diaminopimelate decarboxylase [Candidatus Angelobacter sp.]|jgi:diaminopimelate decarboxylase|nr:diaminopimelate decarboxylase [Candidatus Angelobacter sp.]